ncbi:hypothetical protein EMCRGX_G030268 [Ephydatia muelleri]
MTKEFSEPEQIASDFMKEGSERETRKSLLGLSKSLLALLCEDCHTRIKELLLDIVEATPKEHEERGVLEKDETVFLTDVIMEQMEGLLTGK